MKIAMIGQKGVVVGDRGGGIEVHVAEISRRLVGLGHQVTVYARAAYDPYKKSSYFGARVIFLPTIYRKNIEAIIHTFISTLHAVTQGNDIIHYHGVGPATLAWIPRIFSPKSRVIVTFHSQDKMHGKWGKIAKAYLGFGEWAAAKFPHYCITVSHVLQVYVRDVLRRQAIYIPNGAEIKAGPGSDLLASFGLSSKQYVLNVGRVVPQKGIHFLVAAWKKLETDKKLVIVGAPSFTDAYIKDLKKQAHDDPRIIFLGFQKGRTLDQLYANAYLYVHPSEAEGLPLVILEAMSFGIAPLVSDIPPNVEAIHGAGWTFRSTDVEDLTARLRFLLVDQDEVRSRGELAREIVRTKFNWDIIASRIEGVYISSRH